VVVRSVHQPDVAGAGSPFEYWTIELKFARTAISGTVRLQIMEQRLRSRVNRPSG